MPAPLRTFLFGLAIFLAQWLVFGRLTLWGAYPDVVILFVAWVGIKKGRQWGALTGFGFGFLMDAVYDTWGLHMLVKTLVGFMLGLFPASDREGLLIVPRQALLGGFVVSFVHNGLFVVLLALQAGATNSFLIWGLWVGSALYTACLGTLGSLFGNS